MYTKKNDKTAIWIIKKLKKYKLLKCNNDDNEKTHEETNELNRSISYNEVLGNININLKKECENLAILLEKIFTVIFLLAFIIYCVSIFVRIPN